MFHVAGSATFPSSSMSPISAGKKVYRIWSDALAIVVKESSLGKMLFGNPLEPLIKMEYEISCAL